MTDTSKREELIERPWTQDHYVTRNSISEDDTYRVWMTCRCGWNSGDLPDGNLPTTHQAELEHYVAVFEQAHTPTDDEREALTERLADELEYRVRTAVALSKGGHDHRPQVAEGRASIERITAGFRRTAVQEPTECLDCGRTDGGCDRIMDTPTDDEREAVEAETERLWPTDRDYSVAQTAPVFSVKELDAYCASAFTRGARFALRLRRTVQGEPSVTVATKPAIDEVRKVLDYYADEIDVNIWQEIASAVDDVPDCETWTAVPHAEHVQGEPTDAQVLAALNAATNENGEKK